MTETPHENQIVQARAGTLTLDVALYEHYLQNWQVSDQEKHALLQTLWDLICEFVFLGFGVSPIQQVIPQLCGQTEAGSAINSASGQDGSGRIIMQNIQRTRR